MMNILKFISVSLLLFINLTGLAEEKQFSPEVQQKLKTRMEELIKEINAPGFNVGIWIPGEGSWESSFGVANKATGEEMTLDKHFRIGSITKTFVGTAILQLVDKGDISLNDKISKYIDNVPNGDKITIRQLANMTSGLANYSEDEEWVTKTIYTKNNRNVPTSELLSVAFKLPPTFAPGKGWHYSNTNTILLGQVIEKVSGLSLDKYLQKNIFTPLGLDNTSYPLDEKIPSPYTHGYTIQTLDGKEDDATLNNPSWTNAAGQMISTFADLKIWAKALGTGALLSEKAFKERLKWVSLHPNTKIRKYGFAVGSNRGWINHTGSLPGYNCVVAYLPEKQAIFVAMVNSDIEVVKKDKKIALTDMVFEAVTKIVTPENVPVK